MRHRHGSLLVLSLLGALAACDQRSDGLPTGAQAAAGTAPLLAAADAVPGRYVVVLKGAPAGPAASASVAAQTVAAYGGRVHHSYGAALNGFSATLTPAAVEALRRNPQVAYVAQDGMAHLDSTQTGATWGLDRVDQRTLPLNGGYTYTQNGAGVRVYVIDSGIYTSHSEFGGRASVGTDLVGDGQNGQDCNGHGTHVSGTIAGSTWGVAKAAQVIAVRVFACSGGAEWSTVIAAVDWVTANAQKPAVTNMSLGGGYYQPLNDAVQASIASGIVYTLSAGNSSADACNQSPAATPAAITVASTTSDDVRSWFSNYGTCVDLFAPGSNITSAWWGGTTAINTISGTSMASPHVAGVAALYLQANPTATPAQVAARLVLTASGNVVVDPVGSPNKLVFSPLTEPPPGATIGLSLTDAFFTFVRPVAGSSAAAPAGASPQRFLSVSGGAAKPASTPAGEQAVMQTTQSAQVVLHNAGTTALNWNATSDRPWASVSPANGRLTEGYFAPLTATVSSTGLAAGSHTGTLTVADPQSTNGSAQVNLHVDVLEPTLLRVGTPVTGLTATYGTRRYYAVEVPTGATSLRIALSGGTGDADLYVRQGVLDGWWDCISAGGSNEDSCQVEWPLPGIYYVMIYAFNTYSGLSISATSGGPPAAPLNLASRATTPTAIQSTWTDGSVNEDGFALSRRQMTGGAWGAWTDVASPAANATLFTNTNLAAGGTYQFRLRACNAAGCSAWATGPAVTIPTAPASPPFGVQARAVTGTSIALTWTDGATDETHFNIARALRNLDGTWGDYATVSSPGPNTVAFTNSGLLAGREYRYQVRACNAVGCSAWAAGNAVALPTTPAAPPSLTAAATAPGTIRVQWTDGSTNEASFTVARAPVSSTGVVGTFADVATLAPNQLLFTHTGVPLGTYRYRVRACNAAGCSAWTPGTDVVLPPAPAAPTGVSAAALSSTAIRVTWTDAATTESSYQVYRMLRNLDGTWGAWTSIANPGPNTTTYDNTGLTAGRTYRYQVRACNVTGCSAWGVSAQVSTPP